MDIISIHPWGHYRIIGNRFMVQYAVDLDRMQLMGSYGDLAYSSITKHIGFKVEDYAWMENH